jgi:hypothetical protein
MIATIAYSIIAALQLRAINGQLTEMSVQTENARKVLEETKRANMGNAEDSQRAYQLSREALESVQKGFHRSTTAILRSPEGGKSQRFYWNTNHANLD